MTGLGGAAALLLALVFAWSGAAKLASRRRTATTFAAFGLPAAGLLAVALPVAELALAVGLFTVPGAAAWAALVLLAAFTAVLARAVRSGSEVGCGCFGSARLEPVSSVELARNALLAGAALLATQAEAPPNPDLPAVLVVAAAAGLVVAVLARLDRTRRAGPSPRRA